MPRSTIATRRSNHFDAELELRDYDAAALSATGNETAVELSAARLDEFAVVIDTPGYSSYAAGTAQWTVSVAVATTSGGSYTTVGSVVLTGGKQQIRLPLEGSFIEDLSSADVAYIRATATKTGSPGTLSYGAYVTPKAS